MAENLAFLFLFQLVGLHKNNYMYSSPSLNNATLNLAAIVDYLLTDNSYSLFKNKERESVLCQRYSPRSVLKNEAIAEIFNNFEIKVNMNKIQTLSCLHVIEKILFSRKKLPLGIGKLAHVYLRCIAIHKSCNCKR